MRLSEDARVFSLGGIPMVGNVRTSGVIGLTGASRQAAVRTWRPPSS